jgi:holo-[acyl-carrier protein] synthase
LILGVGIDLCHVRRIRRSVDRLGEAWIEEIFTAEERVYCVKALDSAHAFARGFACKEACGKALGSGFAKGVHPRDIILSSNGGSWDIGFQGAALRQLRQMTPAHHTARSQIAVADLGEFLSCIVVIEAIPTPPADGTVGASRPRSIRAGTARSHCKLTPITSSGHLYSDPSV